jgi:glycosyltransferase involved in cell wall biosynthesis
MNILHVSAVKTWGGGENHLENLCFEFDFAYKEHVTIHVLSQKKSKLHENLKSANASTKLHTAPLLFKADIRFSLKIISICKLHKIDLIHLHDPTALTLTVIADKLSSKLPPFILHKKTSFPIKNRKKTLFKYNYPKIKKVVCVSKATEKITLESIKDESKVLTIYNGIRFDNKNMEPSFLVCKKFNIPQNKTIVGTIGNHIRAKDLTTYINVVNEIINVKQNKNFHFVQIGAFTERTEKYMTLVEKFGLKDYITFTGFAKNASSFLPQFDLFLLTSQSEGLPQVINEAFYFKIPVISTNAGGITDILTDGKTGFVANIHDYKTLSENIIISFEEKSLSKEIADNAYKQLIDGFSTKIMARKTFELYKSILE